MKAQNFLMLVVGILVGTGVSTWHTATAARLDTHSVNEQFDTVHMNDLRLFTNVMALIREEYVEERGDSELIRSAISGMVKSLDPYSVFLSAEALRDVQSTSSGDYAGIGVELNALKESIVVVNTIADSPAETVGIVIGDQIVKVNDIDVAESVVELAMEEMRGDAGSELVLQVERTGVEDVLEYTLVRDTIHIDSVTSYSYAPGYAYLAIDQFREATAREVKETIARLIKDNGGSLDGLIVDLRGNPGGVLNAAVQTVDAFLEKGLIVSADGRTRGAEFSFDAQHGDVLGGAPVVILVDRMSASAAEIVAGALQDHKRGVVMGEKTFGKGSVQSIVRLPDGEALKLTTSHYYTPSGRSIHGAGIVPDIVITERMAPEKSSDWPLVQAKGYLLNAHRVD